MFEDDVFDSVEKVIWEEMVAARLNEQGFPVLGPLIGRGDV